ncbi:membrane protease YdiL (CAAX protease family) [Caldalkalibacillus uzonensis]|uniref:Membrane protease YdiL (CAAX protease family) n=1 Tax=Caldalkalibacillus uzonensis TaxID=353224 RepID=A0ABU0CPG6_9BACI|nr:CPBP family intramembrane glutamic endopeptidase [Caldalkalibacillus uzonensis]MDQ0337786.1 membrane protease YdiL (CAAX protease family) [Caldalkalibacillus uzonensis]
MNMRDMLEQMDNRTLYLNLVLTQAILLVIGLSLYFFFLRHTLALPLLLHTEELFLSVLAGFGFAGVVLVIDLILMNFVPKTYFDDGGVNERLFRDVNVWQIVLIALGVALVEEWLFRAVLQNMIGWFWASLLFALIHFRYLHQWLYALLVIMISFGFGWLYEWTGSFWAVFTAHFTIDFTLGVILRYRLLPFPDK